MEPAAEVERLLKAERYAEAERLLDELIAAGPKDPAFFHQRALSRHFQNDREPEQRRRRVAEDLLAAVEAGRATFAEETIQSCSLLFHWIYKEEGEAAVAILAAERPGDGAAALYQRARVLERYKNDPAAVSALLDRSIALEPHWRSHLFRARLRDRAVDYPGAAEDLDAAVRLEPGAREAWMARARLRVKLGQADGAAADFEKAFSLREPKGYEEWTESAQTHLENGEPAKAAEDFGRALDYLPGEPPEFLTRRADARRLAGDITGARKDVERALEKDPAYEPALRLKARISGLG